MYLDLFSTKVNKLSLFDKFLDTIDINMIYNLRSVAERWGFLVNTFDINMIYNDALTTRVEGVACKYLWY